MIQVHRKEDLILLILPRKSKTITSIHHARTSASELASRSLNQNLPSVLDIDSLPGGQRGEAAAGEVKEVTIYGFAICRFIGWGDDGGGGEIREERLVDEIRANVF